VEAPTVEVRSVACVNLWFVMLTFIRFLVLTFIWFLVVTFIRFLVLTFIWFLVVASIRIYLPPRPLALPIEWLGSTPAEALTGLSHIQILLNEAIQRTHALDGLSKHARTKRSLGAPPICHI
jgi:hypothetical protein